MLTVRSNPVALAARHSLYRTNLELAQVTNRLATGLRINRGSDDPAGLIASEQLRSEIRSLEARTTGMERAYAQANITDGHLSQLTTLLADMQRLVVAGANDAGLTDAERQANQLQIDSLATSIQRFAGDALESLDYLTLPDGGNADIVAAVQTATASAASLSTGGANDLDSGQLDAAQNAIDAAVTAVAESRGRIGAYQRNTVEPGIRSNLVAIENLVASESRIRDADYVAETSRLAQLEVIHTANVMSLKIAHQVSTSVLSLLTRE